MSTFEGWNAELYHHGIKGQKWGVRRFQNEDGSLTSNGRQHYKKNTEVKSNMHERRRKYRKQAKIAAAIAGGLAGGSIAAINAGGFASDIAYSKAMKEAAAWRKIAHGTNKEGPWRQVSRWNQIGARKSNAYRETGLNAGLALAVGAMAAAGVAAYNKQKEQMSKVRFADINKAESVSMAKKKVSKMKTK